MYEKVSPGHPDKLADRIASAIVDLAYTREENPKIAVEALLGHGECNIIIESSVIFTLDDITPIVGRIVGEGIKVNLKVVPQDEYLAGNQITKIRCGDNGIFKGVPLTEEERELSQLARDIYSEWSYDGKYILDKKTNKLIVCQSNAKDEELRNFLSLKGYTNVIINPLGEWVGGINVDTGAVNRKLGSDMAQSVTGGGLWGKDFSKADVSANIWAFEKAQETGKVVQLYCAIGDTNITGYIGNKKVSIPYKEIVDFAKDCINGLGGFEAVSEWGLV